MRRLHPARPKMRVQCAVAALAPSHPAKVLPLGCRDLPDGYRPLLAIADAFSRPALPIPVRHTALGRGGPDRDLAADTDGVGPMPLLQPLPERAVLAIAGISQYDRRRRQAPAQRLVDQSQGQPAERKCHLARPLGGVAPGCPPILSVSTSGSPAANCR